MPAYGGKHWRLLGYALRVEWIPARIRLFREAGLCQSQDKFAKTLGFVKRTIGNAERATHPPSLALRRALDHALENASDAQRARFFAADHGAVPAVDGELEALELSRRVAASDVGDETVSRLELAVDDLATRYPSTPPAALLADVRRHLGYVMRLVEARTTLREHHRLLVTAGWLSLLAATLQIDLVQRAAAAGWLATATSLAQETEHAEILAWRHETEAWQVLTDGDYPRAVTLSQAAQTLAPCGSSAAIQATAQEGRAWARRGAAKDTYGAINRVAGLAAQLPQPDQPEHHYRYDPDKALVYTATTLAWVGDPAAERYAREVIARLGSAQAAGRRPRRVALAQIDLALALLASDQPDEASAAVLGAMLSGWVVPSNHWRALEVVTAVEARGLSEATELREAYAVMRRS
ncbi:MAG: XRE family transcriptional regulator [Pseudonocardiaceae bacterium]